ncbi:alpha/beta fold hydrolase [Rhizorhabdus histidinilytica]|uniref:2-hydroxymuconate-semialdehyde hydrolase n=1 Tax=Rhizorhabdus histidinilytica TaxID=439228 RepID=A0A1T5GY23_9SPHN|nr:alpha/beta hydrolase [Rhizorhabdus histidinilytica]SKC13200.1 2-hydroxymuconate-semialdehyde hydrolase [Rhizorhabdus histidinilytica]
MEQPSDTGRRLEVAGSTTHFHDLGSGEPLLLLPAYGPLPGTTGWLTYSKVLPYFVERRRCIIVDYHNFGLSSPFVFDEPAHDVFVRQVKAVLDHLGIARCDVVGTSTGGTVAIDLALSDPGRVSRMVVGACEASTGGDPYLLSPWPSEVGKLSAEYQGNPPDLDRLRRLLNAIVYDPATIDEGTVLSILEWAINEPKHAEAWSRSRSVPSGKLDRLKEIEASVRIIHGRFDRMVPVEGAIRLMNYLADPDLVILNRCGHWPAFERPDEFARQVLGFLAR